MIYIISNGKFLKIGISQDPVKRCAGLQTGSSDKLILLASFKCKNDPEAETKAHASLDRCRVNGEWFDTTLKDAISAIVSTGELYGDEAKQKEFKFINDFQKDKRFLEYKRAFCKDDYEFERELSSALKNERDNVFMRQSYQEFLKDFDELGDVQLVVQKHKKRAKDLIKKLRGMFDKDEEEH